ncbi:MAG TPA: hypothetical protein VMW80_10250 [Candidatus Dormibacteraeota bacterium]|nr:hypothetical protein [Candidatus Dormibacteraeota bacterium]
MAEIQVEGDDLVLVLSRLEKVEGVHGDIRVPLSAVRDVEVVDRPLDLIQGLKMPGTGIPGMTAVGTWVSADGKTFAVEHHASRGIVVHLDGQSYQQLVVGSDDPEALAERVRTGMGTPGR